MSEPSTQKLLLAITCVFGVVLVLVGYGRQRTPEFQRSSYYPNSMSAGTPVEMSPAAPAPPQHFPATHPNYQVWRSAPVPAPPNLQVNHLADRQPLERAPEWTNPTVVENYFDSSPLVPPASRKVAQHPIAQRRARNKQRLTQAPSPSTQTWPAQTSGQFADNSYVQQAGATRPVENSVSNVRQTDFESPIPETDFSTRPKHDHQTTPQLATNRKTTNGHGIVFHEITPKPSSTALALNAPHSVLTREPSPTTPSPIRIDKQVRKANWAEIELAPAPDAKTARPRPRSQVILPIQRGTPQVEASAREQVRYGQSLARRRAFFAAREELVRALLVIASSYQTESSAHAYTERLAQALVALDEASDLMNFRGDSNSQLFQQTLLSHETQLLAPQDIQTVTPMTAIGIYSSFAQAQIEQAIGMSPAGSEALHALGKLESIVPETNIHQARTNQTKTLVFYRAALNINPANTTCANDLGVLLYKMGRLQEAELALKASLNTAQSQLSWTNLALVHNQHAATAGTTEERNQQLTLANSAAEQAKRFANEAPTDQPSDGQWATATDFQNNAAFPNVVLQNAVNRSATNTPQPSGSGADKLKQKLKEWF